jgi:Zn-dependent peptidase ImmA (M78 family)
MVVRRKHIRSLVERLLAEHRVRSAPVPVRKIANALGVEVQEEPADDDLSGFMYRNRKRKVAIIGVNSDHHPNRQNFTAAHELGHYLLHEFDDLHIDRQFKVWLRNEASSKGTDIEEKEANLFAAELLMPASFLEEDLEEIGAFDALDEDTLAELAEKYGVSTQAMTFRLAYLGYLQQ